MGTRSLIFVRKRIPKKVCLLKKSALGGPAESQYIYEYFACFYQQWDGYVEGGVGEKLAEFLCEFLRDFSSKHMDTGFLAAKIVAFFMEENPYDKFLQHLTTLDKMFSYDHQIAYIVTTDSTRQFFDDKSIMLSYYGGHVLTARPEKFMKTFESESQLEREPKVAYEVINHGDDEVEKEGYLAEDLLLAEFLRNRENIGFYY